MANALVIVCDVKDCGEVATATVTFKVQGSAANRQKDLCAKHLSEIEYGARAATRGRPRKKETARRPAARQKRTAKRKPRTVAQHPEK